MKNTGTCLKFEMSTKETNGSHLASQHQIFGMSLQQANALWPCHGIKLKKKSNKGVSVEPFFHAICPVSHEGRTDSLAHFWMKASLPGMQNSVFSGSHFAADGLCAGLK